MITKAEIMMRIADLEFELLDIKDRIEIISHKIDDVLTPPKKTTKKAAKK